MTDAYVLRSAFAVGDDPRTGNPAAVCVVHRNRPGDDDVDAFDDFFNVHSEASVRYQALATELDLSETAFAIREKPFSSDDNSNSMAEYRIRWFTPTQEIGLCGHASMATASRALEFESASRRGISFTHRDGEITIERDANDTARFYMEMDASAPSSFEGSDVALATIRDAFESSSAFASDEDDIESSLANTKFTVRRNSIGDTFLVIQSSRSDDASACDSVARAYLRLPKPSLENIALVGCRGVCVVVPRTPAGLDIPLSASGARPEYCVRWFGPLVGIEEDPVTGSACCGVAPLLDEITPPLEPSRDGFRFGYQHSRRGGHVWCAVTRSSGRDRVRVAGRCVSYEFSNPSRACV